MNENVQPSLIWQNAKIHLLLDLHNTDIMKSTRGTVIVGIDNQHDFMDISSGVHMYPGSSLNTNDYKPSLNLSMMHSKEDFITTTRARNL